MIGRNPIQDGGILNQPHDGMEATIRSRAIYARELSIPWSVGWGPSGIQASPATHGRGMTSVSNKVDEHNIYNAYPILFGVNLLPPQTFAPQTRRVRSRVIPALGMGVTGR